MGLHASSSTMVHACINHLKLSEVVIVVLEPLEQGNYSLRRPPKLIISPMFNEQSGYSKKLY